MKHSLDTEDIVSSAREFAIKAHEGQLRKGTEKPYIVHPIEVAEIVATMTDDVEIIGAAFLHDTLEDCEEITEALLLEKFGPRITNIILEESEDKSKSWMERKSHTIAHLKEASIEVQMVALGDKLSNMRDIARDYPVCGESLWERFRMKSKETIGWYYKGVRASLNEKLGTTDSYIEYSNLVDQVFG